MRILLNMSKEGGVNLLGWMEPRLSELSKNF